MLRSKNTFLNIAYRVIYEVDVPRETASKTPASIHQPQYGHAADAPTSPITYVLHKVLYND